MKRFTRDNYPPGSTTGLPPYVRRYGAVTVLFDSSLRIAGAFSETGAHITRDELVCALEQQVNE